ncbi:putative GPI-anchored adhesin-like protein PGA55 [Forsythia ovata]|uniref:E3 ubiquitin-protein ligase RMA n=1 Tax=Forsythia ovata TaxID=205694 RepID=A0ABD1VHD6_9LAMI
MGDNNFIGENLMDLDLNQEPLDPIVRFGSFLNELGTPHGNIEERIRQLEAVTARTRQRQRWRQARNSIETSPFPGQRMVNVDGEIGVLDGVDSVNVLERTGERERGCKRDSSHLVAKALAMDPEVKKVDRDGGSFFDCNICLDTAREPVLTCCGHLFCWSCFYQVSYIDSTCKECPVCKGEVSDSTVIPIYGNGSNDSMLELESESVLKIPPRPKARRVESVRQQQITRTLSQIPVAEALRRIRISIGAMGDQTQELHGVDNLSLQSDTSEMQNAEIAVSRRSRNQQYSRVLSERALSNVDRLAEDVETLLGNRLSRLDNQLLSFDGRNPLIRNSASIQSDRQPPGSRGEINMVLPIPSSSRMSDIPGDVVDALSVMTDSGIGLPVAPSTSFRRRRITSRVSNVDDRDSRESRRRRLS